MKRLSALLVLLVLCSSFITAHKFYVSVTQIEYVASKQHVQIISRVFIDDLEDVLQARYDESLIITEKEAATITPVVSKYFKKKLSIQIDNQIADYKFLGFEIDNDLMLCYLEINNVKDFNTITVDNQLLMDQFVEQQNIVHVKKEEVRKSVVLEDGNHKGMLNFSN
ncbi:DUF6702 family protein [Aquimarina sp. 2-A2]|uniref:DUF6702 family protein n=1 Tax=Aquimarina sp. 2-A2 TaxID=3382644 RepID=UPI00387F0499